MFQLQFYFSSLSLFFSTQPQIVAFVCLSEKILLNFSSVCIWWRQDSKNNSRGAGRGLPSTPVPSLSCLGGDIALRCENMAKSCPAQSTSRPTEVASNYRLSLHTVHTVHQSTWSVRALLAQARATKNGSPGAIQLKGRGGRSARFCSAGVVCLSTRPSVWNFINILLLFFSLSSCGRCVVFLNLLKAGQIAEKKLAVRGT